MQVVCCELTFGWLVVASIGDIDDQVGHQGDFWDINSEELVGLTSQLNV